MRCKRNRFDNVIASMICLNQNKSVKVTQIQSVFLFLSFSQKWERKLPVELPHKE